MEIVLIANRIRVEKLKKRGITDFRGETELWRAEFLAGIKSIYPIQMLAGQWALRDWSCTCQDKRPKRRFVRESEIAHFQSSPELNFSCCFRCSGFPGHIWVSQVGQPSGSALSDK